MAILGFWAGVYKARLHYCRVGLKLQQRITYAVEQMLVREVAVDSFLL